VAGAVKGSGGEGGAAGSDKEAESLRRNWWAASREVVRVTKGKGLIVSSGAENVGDLRAPKDAENLFVTSFRAESHMKSDITTQVYVCLASCRIWHTMQ
jgi:ribonuclease P/MRP protein subunit RPP1